MIPVHGAESAALLAAHSRGESLPGPWRDRGCAPPGVHVAAEDGDYVVTVSVRGSARWAQELTGEAAWLLAQRLLRRAPQEFVIREEAAQ